MKKYLLPAKNQYKANLHCHSTVSDGKKTPEQIKEFYKNAGYSILAYSDHNTLVPHNDLRDDSFLPITATEIDVTDWSVKDWVNAPTYHINFYAKNSENNEFIPLKREYTVDMINDMIKRAAEAGFVAQYNHPRWSLQLPKDFLPLEGLGLFEVYNNGCQKEMSNGYGDYEYETMLRSGKYVLPSATDDNHNFYPDDTAHSDSFGGFDMFYMDKLDYDEFFKALKNGDMYASTSPIIKELTFEDNKIHLECSPCNRVLLRTESRSTHTYNSHNEDIVSQDFPVDFNYDWRYIRIEIHDIKGAAYTRAYTREELTK